MQINTQEEHKTRGKLKKIPTNFEVVMEMPTNFAITQKCLLILTGQVTMPSDQWIKLLCIFVKSFD